jgi:hypothetical protein
VAAAPPRPWLGSVAAAPPRPWLGSVAAARNSQSDYVIDVDDTAPHIASTTGAQTHAADVPDALRGAPQRPFPRVRSSLFADVDCGVRFPAR